MVIISQEIEENERRIHDLLSQEIIVPSVKIQPLPPKKTVTTTDYSIPPKDDHLNDIILINESSIVNNPRVDVAGSINVTTLAPSFRCTQETLLKNLKNFPNYNH